MTRMMKWAITLLLIPAAVTAQEPRRGRPGPAPRPARDVAKALLDRSAELDLTADQTARLEALSKEWQENEATVRAGLEKMRGTEPGSLSDEQRAELREARRQSMNRNREIGEQIRSTLTLDQLKKAEPIMIHRRMRSAGRTGAGVAVRARAFRRGRVVAGFGVRAPAFRPGFARPMAPRLHAVPELRAQQRARVGRPAHRVLHRI